MGRRWPEVQRETSGGSFLWVSAHTRKNTSFRSQFHRFDVDPSNHQVMGKIVNQTELADILGRDPSTIWEWQEQGLPIEERGAGRAGHKYDTAKVVAWREDRARAERGETQRDRLTRLQADREELDLQERRRILVPFSEVQPVWTSRVLAAAAYMRSRASQLAGELEVALGIEQKRAVLKKADAMCLTHLGVHGTRMQDELEAVLGELPAARREAFFSALLVGAS